jgi:hypothetical protein
VLPQIHQPEPQDHQLYCTRSCSGCWTKWRTRTGSSRSTARALMLSALSMAPMRCCRNATTYTYIGGHRMKEWGPKLVAGRKQKSECVVSAPDDQQRHARQPHGEHNLWAKSCRLAGREQRAQPVASLTVLPAFHGAARVSECRLPASGGSCHGRSHKRRNSGGAGFSRLRPIINAVKSPN